MQSMKSTSGSAHLNRSTVFFSVLDGFQSTGLNRPKTRGFFSPQKILLAHACWVSNIWFKPFFSWRGPPVITTPSSPKYIHIKYVHIYVLRIRVLISFFHLRPEQLRFDRFPNPGSIRHGHRSCAKFFVLCFHFFAPKLYCLIEDELTLSSLVSLNDDGTFYASIYICIAVIGRMLSPIPLVLGSVGMGSQAGIKSHESRTQKGI